jgi:Bifunctional DNA primase/polymerase, N-terminal
VTSAPVTFGAVAQQLAERGWRPFPGFQASKMPAMRGWPGLNHSEWDDADLAAAMADYQPADDFCCCLAVQPDIVAIDLDIVDQEHAAAADRLADDILGKTPLVRIGLAPKQIRVYRSADPVRSRKLHPLEIFSGTGQFIAYGWHQKAGRPYLWSQASPLDVSADSDTIPLVTRARLDRFSTELFKVVPRRLLVTRQGRPASIGGLRTIGDRLAMLSLLHGSWKRAAAMVLGEAVEGCRNETAWIVIASAAGRGIPDDVVWDLFDRHFCGWAEVSEAQIASMIERARPVCQPTAMTFSASASSRGGNGK